MSEFDERLKTHVNLSHKAESRLESESANEQISGRANITDS